MDEQVMALIEHLGATGGAELADVCEGFLKKIPTLKLCDRGENGDTISGTVDVLAPMDMFVAFNKHNVIPKQYKVRATFYFGPENVAEIKLQDKVIKKGAWFEVVEFILCEARRLRAHEDHL